MSWQKSIQDFKNFLRIERGLADNSVESYQQDLKKLVFFLELLSVRPSPQNIDAATLKGFVYEVGKELKPRSQARLISSLRSFFDFLVYDSYREDNPTDLLESPQIGRTLPDTLSNSEIDDLIAAIDLSHPQGERNKTIIETIYGCGLRVSELINLQLSDLHLEQGYLRILGKGNKYRIVPIHQSTIDQLLYYIDSIRSKTQAIPADEDTVFLNRRGKRLTRQMIFIILKDLAKKINLKKKIGPHTLRHSFATYLLQNGADLRIIQQILGHESITTTEIYVHLDNSYLKEVVASYHPRSERQDRERTEKN